MKVHLSARLFVRKSSALGVLLAGVILWPSLALAWQQPPLAEVARKEAERRKAVKSTQKVITNKDLPESAKRQPAAAPAADASHAPPAAPAADASGHAQPPADAKAAPAASAKGDEASWRARIAQAREAVRRNEAFAEALQSRINALTRDFVNRDNPVQRAKIGEDRQKALEDLQRVRTDVEQGKKQIAEIEEEARKAGVPPGWLR
jgi:hypothetical protein